MRRLVKILSGMALLASTAATVFLLNAPLYRGFVSENGGAPVATTQTLVNANGDWVIYLLMIVTMVTGMPLLMAVARPTSQRLATWAAALLLLTFSILGRLTIGGYYLPGAALLLIAAILILFVRREDSRKT